MSASPACFESNMIGLSRTPCACVDTPPDWATASQSGLFLAELDGLGIRTLDAIKDCGDGGLYNMLYMAREEAIEQTREALMGCIGEHTDRRRRDGVSEIGDSKKAAGTGVRLANPWHGITVQTARIVGGMVQLTHIGVALKTTGTFTLYVYDRESLLNSYVVNAVADQTIWNELPTPLELSTSTQGGPPRYWFVYQPATFSALPTDGLRAMNSIFDCGCGGFQPSWNERLPQYLSTNSKNGILWAEWSMASGTYGSDITQRENWSTGINPTQGILLRMKFACDMRTTLCAEPPNYMTDDVQKIIAHAVRYKAGANLMTRLLSSPNINRYTMTAGEIMLQNRSRWEKEWNNRVTNWVCPNLVHDINRYGDCLKCKDHTGARRSLIRN